MSAGIIETGSADYVNPPLGIGLKICATLSFAIMVACIKAVPSIPTGEVVFSRSFFALLPLVIYFGFKGQLASAFTTNNLKGQMKRTLAGGISMVMWFFALKLLPLPEALAISFAAPIITLVLAVIVLKETMRIYRWSAAIAGFAGVLVILWPRLAVLQDGVLGDSETIGALLVLASAFLVAVAMIQIRELVNTETTQSIIFYFTFTIMIGSLASLPFGWVWPARSDATLLIGAGVFGGIGQILLTECYRHADASTIAPFEYTSMIWGLAIGYFLFSEVPSLTVVSGAAIVIAAGLFIIHREHQLGLKRGKARRLQSSQN